MLNNVYNGNDLDNASLIVVYDQASESAAALPEDSCLRVLWTKLTGSFKCVRFLKGGFSEFQRDYNALCTNKAQMLQSRQKKPSLDTLSQPCLPNLGPTRILPFLYLGSQVDAMNQELLKVSFFFKPKDPARSLTVLCLFALPESQYNLRTQREHHLPEAGLHSGLALSADTRERQLL